MADKAAGLSIQPDLMDQDANDIALGLSTALLRDGTGLPTADIPWSGHKITDLADGTNPTDAVNVETAQSLIAAGQASYGGALAANPSSVADFTQNNAYYVISSVNFLASGTKALVSGSAWFNHQNATQTQVAAYMDVFDVTSQAVVASGAEVRDFLHQVYRPIGSLSPEHVIQGLTVGHTYQARLWIQRLSTNGPTSINSASARAINF